MSLRAKILAPLAALVLLALLGSFLGGLHPVGDALAVIRPVLAGLAMLLLLAAGRPLWLFRIGMGLALGAAVPLVWVFVQPATPGPVTLYQKNLYYRLPDPRPLLEDIRVTQPDLVTLQEVTPATRQAVLAALGPDYVARHACAADGSGGSAVASRWPMVSGTARCLAPRGAAVMQVEGPGGPVWLVSLHLYWPWPQDQADQLDALLPALGALEGPVVVGGDFNNMPWSRGVVAITRATGTRRAAPALATYRIRGRALLPIDNVLAPGGGRAETRPALRSDHLGLLARVFVW